MTFKRYLHRVFPTARVLLVRASLGRLQLKHLKRILVVGAGTDPYRNLFGNTDVYVAMDIMARPRVTNCVGDAQRLPIKNGMLDCVFASEVFEHLVDPVEFVKQAHNALAAEGQLILTVPFMFHQHADPADYWRPTRGALESILNDFKDVEIIAQGNRLHTISDLITTILPSAPVLYPLRILNWFINLFPANQGGRESSAPSGFLVVARK